MIREYQKKLHWMQEREISRSFWGILFIFISCEKYIVPFFMLSPFPFNADLMYDDESNRNIAKKYYTGQISHTKRSQGGFSFRTCSIFRFLPLVFSISSRWNKDRLLEPFYTSSRRIFEKKREEYETDRRQKKTKCKKSKIFLIPDPWSWVFLICQFSSGKDHHIIHHSWY